MSAKTKSATSKNGRSKNPRGLLQIRLTDEERALADRAAGKAGLPTSTWLRTLMVREARKVLG